MQQRNFILMEVEIKVASPVRSRKLLSGHQKLELNIPVDPIEAPSVADI